WISLTSRPIERTTGLRRLYFRYQWLLVPVLIAFDGPIRQINGWVWVIRALRDPAQRRRAHVYDAVAMFGHYVLWLGVPSLFLPITTVLVFHYGRILM